MAPTPLFNQIGIIGTGKAARALALTLRDLSIAEPLLWGRTAKHLKEAIKLLPGTIEATGPAALLQACDLVVLAVSDSALAEVIANLENAGPLSHSPFIFHISGSNGVDILQPLLKISARTAAIHPAMTFTGNPGLEKTRIKGTHFAVTGSTIEATKTAHTIVKAIGGIPVDIPENRRSLYHAALSHASNHLVTLITGSIHALNSAGVSDAPALLAPLVRSALENTLAKGFAGLSGPILRGDIKTVSAHVTAIANNTPEVLSAYIAMARATLDELERNGAATRESEMKNILQSAAITSV